MTALQGRRYLVFMELTDGSIRTWADIRSGGVWIDDLGWFRPVVVGHPRIERSYAQPMRGLPSWDRVTFDVATLYDEANLSGFSSARVYIVDEIAGAFGDILWTGRVLRGRGVRRSGDVTTFECIDERGWTLAEATGQKRKVDPTKYVNAAQRDVDKDIPVRLGAWALAAIGATCRNLDNGTGDPGAQNDPTYIYNDVLDRDGVALTTTDADFAVYGYDTSAFESAKLAYDAGAILDFTPYVIAHDHGPGDPETAATFRIDRSAADAGLGIVFDVETWIVLAHFWGPVASASELSSVTLHPGRPAAVAATMYQLAGFDMALIDPDAISAVDDEAGAPYVFDTLTESIADDIASLYAATFVQESFSVEGLVTMRPRWTYEPYASDFAIRTRDHVDFPAERWGGLDPFFTTLTLERRPYDFAPDVTWRAGAVTDTLLVEANGGLDVPHVEEVRWISSVTDLATLASYRLRLQGGRVRFADVQIALPDEDISDQLRIQPGQVAGWTFDEGAYGRETVAESGTLAEVMSSDHDMKDLTTRLLLWEQRRERVYGGISGRGFYTVTTSGTSTWVEVDAFDSNSTDGGQNLIEDQANNRLRIKHPGHYRFEFSVTADGDTGRYTFMLGTAGGVLYRAPRTRASFDISSGRLKTCGSCFMVKLTGMSSTSPLDVKLFVGDDGSAKDISIERVHMSARRMYPDDDVPGEIEAP